MLLSSSSTEYRKELASEGEKPLSLLKVKAPPPPGRGIDLEDEPLQGATRATRNITEAVVDWSSSLGEIAQSVERRALIVR